MIRLAAGDVAAQVDLERGGRLSSLEVAGRELLIGPPDATDRSIYWGSFLMAPWAGRIANARLDWDGSSVRLPRRYGRHAIHGLAYDTRWELERSAATEVSMSCELGPTGWPFGGRVRQRLELTPTLLAMHAEVTAERPMPAALGWHPWLRRRTPEVRLTVRAAEILELIGLIPTGHRRGVDALLDLREGPLLGERRLDHAYIEPASPAVVRWPDLELRIGFAPPVQTLIVHTTPGALCVEPQTAWPNAVALERTGVSGTGLVILGAGESLRATATMRWRAIPAASRGPSRAGSGRPG